MLALLLTAAVLTQDADAAPRDGASEPLSPLHTYLGLDPATGEFVDRPAAAEPAAGQKADPPARPQDPAAAFRDAVEQVAGEGDFGGVAELLGGAKGSPLGETFARLAALSWLLLLAYPLGVALSELFGGRDLDEDPAAGAVDRRHYAKRRRRRLVLAGCSAAVVGLLAWGQANWFWTGEPAKLTAVSAAVGLLLLAVVTLQGLVRRMDADYPAAVLREIRMRQDESARELADLRRRVAGRPGAAV